MARTSKTGFMAFTVRSLADTPGNALHFDVTNVELAGASSRAYNRLFWKSFLRLVLPSRSLAESNVLFQEVFTSAQPQRCCKQDTAETVMVAGAFPCERVRRDGAYPIDCTILVVKP